MKNKIQYSYDDINLSKIKMIIFDFDGIFTNNKVTLNQDGIESVTCDRRDGIAIEVLRIYQNKYNKNMDILVISSERNSVVQKRCDKLNIKYINGVKNKLEVLKNNYKNIVDGKGIIFFCNDINDIKLQEFVEWSIVPKDAHKIIKENANFISELRGGECFIRQSIEDIMGIENFIELYF